MSTGTDSGSTTIRTPRQALRFLRHNDRFPADNMTVTKADEQPLRGLEIYGDISADPIRRRSSRPIG